MVPSNIRRIVHDFFRINEPSTLNKIWQKCKDDDDIPKISRATSHRILRDIGFKFKKRERNCLLIEKDEIVSWRYKYLREIKKLRAQGSTIFYLDETWLNVGSVPDRILVDMNIKSCKSAWLDGLTTGLKDRTGKGDRLIILHVGSEDSFLEGGELVFKSRRKNADYYDDMNGEDFEKWFKETLLPKLPPNSVIVMDNASYHSVRM
ncbi:uncharacterized protein LOC141904300 [Tubulanus polymorphus]|uniref:uncharacterized protein LOC141904300 n=1 Tax=Tubulanus polymorphus TaxID=672921 RepID=UPI003DA47AC3